MTFITFGFITEKDMKRMGSEDKTVIVKNPKSESQYTALLYK
jgi:hypothetical protein